MLKEVVAYFKIRKILNREQKLMTMKMTTSNVIQILLGLCDILNIILPLTSGKVKIWVGAALGILHVIVNTVAHQSNPDGTPAEVAYIPPQK